MPEARQRASAADCLLVESDGIRGIDSAPGHIMAYSDREIRQEYEVVLLGHPADGTPRAEEEVSDVA